MPKTESLTQIWNHIKTFVLDVNVSLAGTYFRTDNGKEPISIRFINNFCQSKTFHPFAK